MAGSVRYTAAMLITMALSVLAAWLIAKRVSVWWKWLAASLLAGALVAISVALATPLFGAMLPGQAVVRAIATAPLAALFCALCAWGFSRKRA